MALSYIVIIAFFLLALVVLGGLAVVVLLLSNIKTRPTTLSLLRVGGLAVAAFVVVVAFFPFYQIGIPSSQLIEPVGTPPLRSATVSEIPGSIPPPSASDAQSPANVVEKGEDEYSKAVASRTVGMLRAMVRALGQALAEEEKNLEAKKDAGPKPAVPEKPSPAWVNASPRRVGDVFQMSVAVGPYTTRRECDAKLPDALQEALDQYVEVYLGEQAEARVRLPLDVLLEQVVQEQWEEVRQYSVGPMTRLHVLLQFDRKIKDRVLEEYKRGIIARRLWIAGGGLASVLGVLALFYGFLRIAPGGKATRQAS